MILTTGAFSSAGTASKIATPPVIPQIAASKADFMQNLMSLSPRSLLRKLRGEVPEKFQNAIGDAIAYCQVFNRSHDAVIHGYDEAGNVIEAREHAGGFKDY